MRVYQTLLFVLLVGLLVAAQQETHTRNPQLSSIPEWARQGRFTFMRLDGGYIEREKAKRSNWASTWSQEESETLGNLYTQHLEQTIELLKQAGVTWVWVTWSNGWSHEYEAAQWKELRNVIEKLHGAGIRVTAYFCATTMFWENMFLHEPRSVTWLSFVPRNRPLIYGGDLHRPAYPYTSEWQPRTYGAENPFRFVADVGNPEWREYVKVRVSAALDAGVDAFFFDNPFVGYAPAREVNGFFEEIQHFIKRVKGSSALVSTNVGLPPSVAFVNEQCEVVFNEFGVEPGIYEGVWNTANIRKVRYIRGMWPEKPHMYQTGTGRYRSGRREVSIMIPKSQKLAIAEAAALQSNFLNLLEGRFLKGLIQGEEDALQSWRAIGEYNKFLLKHQELYVNAQAVPELLVVASDEWPFGFDWQDESGLLFDFLAEHSIQYDVSLMSRLNAEQLSKYPLVVLPGIETIPEGARGLLRHYQDAGGTIYAIGGSILARTLADLQSSSQVLGEVRRREVAGTEVIQNLEKVLKKRLVQVRGAPTVLGLVSRIGGTNRVLLHLLNYHDAPQTNVQVQLDFGFLPSPLSQSSFRAYSPDPGTGSIEKVEISGKRAELVVSRIETYVVIPVNF